MYSDTGRHFFQIFKCVSFWLHSFLWLVHGKVGIPYTGFNHTIWVAVVTTTDRFYIEVFVGVLCCHFVFLDFSVDVKAFVTEEKEEIWLSPMTFSTESSKKSNVTSQNAIKNFGYTTIADRLRTVSWSNDSHPTDVVKPVYEIQAFPLRTKSDPFPFSLDDTWSRSWQKESRKYKTQGYTTINIKNFDYITVKAKLGRTSCNDKCHQSRVVNRFTGAHLPISGNSREIRHTRNNSIVWVGSCVNQYSHCEFSPPSNCSGKEGKRVGGGEIILYAWKNEGTGQLGKTKVDLQVSSDLEVHNFAYIFGRIA